MNFKILFFLVFTLSFFPSQSLNVERIKKEIYDNNRHGDQIKSQNKLLTLLDNGNLLVKDQVELNLLLANTYRSINDYATSIVYLKRSKELASTKPDLDSLQMGILTELSFVYFDSQNYPKSEQICREIIKKNFKYLEPNSKAYIIMQMGYINFLRSKNTDASAEYMKALEIIKKYSPCNQPVIMVKQMQLYGKESNFDLVEKTYRKILKISDSCSILKYKIYATEEIISIFKQQNNSDKTFYYGKIFDSLNHIYNREERLSILHAENDNFKNQIIEEEKSQNLLQSILYSIFILFLFILGFFLYKRSVKLKKDKLKIESELNKIKLELKEFLNFQNSDTTTTKTNMNLEKLNKKQKELLRLISKGLTNKEIADILCVTEATVKYHIRNIYTILDIKNRKDIFKNSIS